MSEETIILHNSPMMYDVIREASGALVIEVVVGTIALYTVRVRLDASEQASFEREGAIFSDAMARAIMSNPVYNGRSYPA